MTDFPESPRLLTADVPGVGGSIKRVPEDFEVEEIPAYEPSGTGEFLYLWIEKRALGAEYFLRQISRRLDIPVGAIGSAGLKDRHAVTRQMISVPVLAEERLASLDGEGIKLLGVHRHGNKLRAGHLRGNRFRVVIRDHQPDSADRLCTIVERLKNLGLPNFFGAQRFGRDGETLRQGLALFRKDVTTRQPRNPFLRKLALSAVQSHLFNRYLDNRIDAGLFRQVLLGDVMTKKPFGGLFVVSDCGPEQRRFDERETIHTGPIFGRKTFAAREDAAAREANTLAEAGFCIADFAGFGKLLQGTRRPNLVYVDDLAVEVIPGGLQLTFSLPAGSYATILLREIMKNLDTRIVDELEEV